MMISGGIKWMLPIKFGEPLECLCLGFHGLALSTPAGYVLATWLYVLATWLGKDPRGEEEDKQQKKRVGRDQRITADDKQSGLQKNGTTRFPAESNNMSHGDADTEYMYYGGGSTALMVTKREKAQDQYDTYMSQYDIFMSKCDTKTQQGLKSSDAGRMLLRDSTAPTMSITSEQFEDAIAAAADAAARRALDAMTAQAVSNRGASQHFYDSIVDAITEEKKLSTVAEPVVPTRFPTWLLMISMGVTVFLALWWRLTVTSSEEGCTGVD